MKILVTGANGLVGRHLLAAGGAEFYAATRQPAPNAVWLSVDLAQTIDVSTFPRTLDAIVYLAQSNRYRDLPAGADDLIAVNVNGVVQMLQYAAQLDPKPHVIIASTGDVYGRSQGELLRESDALFQNIAGQPSLYPLSRKLAEDYATSFASHYGLTLTIIRLFHVYGGGMPATALIARLHQSILTEQPIRLDGEQGIFINPTYVTDVVNAIQNILTQSAPLREAIEVYNVASDHSYSLKQVAELIGEQVGKTPQFTHAPAPQALYITPSIGKLKAHYGNFETTDFPAGLALSRPDG